MIAAYVQKALDRAHYEMIDDPNPFYGEVPGLEGVWASGRTLEDCRRELAEAIEDWVLFGIAKGRPIPPMEDVEIHVPAEVVV
jgi:predicted RNase H-like HicB family nuclease